VNRHGFMVYQVLDPSALGNAFLLSPNALNFQWPYTCHKLTDQPIRSETYFAEFDQSNQPLGLNTEWGTS
jgi:hypothetical protein